MISLCVFAIVSFNHGSEHCRALRTLCCSSTILHCCVEARSSFVRVRMPVRGLAIDITARNTALRCEACLTLQLIPIVSHQIVTKALLDHLTTQPALPPNVSHLYTSHPHLPTSSHIKATLSPLITSPHPPNQQHTATCPQFQPPATDPRCRSAKARSATSEHPQTILRSMAQERESPTCLFSSLYAFAKHGWARWEAPFCPK